MISMCGDIRHRLIALEGRVASAEAAITIPTDDYDRQEKLAGYDVRGEVGACARETHGPRAMMTLTVGEAVQAHGQVCWSWIAIRGRLSARDSTRIRSEFVKGDMRMRAAHIPAIG